MRCLNFEITFQEKGQCTNQLVQINDLCDDLSVFLKKKLEIPARSIHHYCEYYNTKNTGVAL
uniref:Uncharacterized protein n=1 Tax=Aegilops tauschii subsp. strangulata TaxID=200361 RepID=A0A452XIT3_AEGTS